MKHLKKWTHPDSYMGATWDDYYVSGVGQHQDSDALERANFQAMRNALSKVSDEGLDDNSAGWIAVQENHWAVGWVEWIAIHEKSAALLKVADDIAAGLEGYPVIDGSLWSEYEDAECGEVWESCFDRRGRLKYLRDHADCKLAHFRDWIAAARGSWYHAGNILPCPSDLLC